VVTPESPVPPPPLVALGIILEAPFLPQLVAPAMMNAHVTSTLLASPADSVTTFVSGGPGILLSSQFTAGSAEKVANHHYTPPDLKPLIASLEKQRAEIAEAREAAQDPAASKEFDQALSGVDANLAELRGGKAPPPALTRSTFHETSGGDIAIDGETLYEYDGPNIVKATTTTRSSESPPVVIVAEKTFEYDLTGRLTQIVQYETPTKFKYDPGGRVLSSDGEFSSPEGDFKVSHRTMYIYAPPQSPGPIPGNAIMSSVCESRSGPEISMRKEREGLELPPLAPGPPSEKPRPPIDPMAAPTDDQLEIPAKPGLSTPKGLDPTKPATEFTTTISTYVYA
jgi:hypothetical protein